MRQDIYDMFLHYAPEFQYRWNKIISAGFKAFAAELHKLAASFEVEQSVDNRRVIWKDTGGNVEALFAYIIDPTDIDSIIATYLAIKSMDVPVTYAIIEQRGDGDQQYDIFRLSENSYMEHANRAYVEGTSCDAE